MEKILELGIDPREGASTNGTPLDAAKLLATKSSKGREIYTLVKSKCYHLKYYLTYGHNLIELNSREGNTIGNEGDEP